MKDILFLIGSDSDRDRIAPGIELAEEKGYAVDLRVLSAHRDLEKLTAFMKSDGKDVITSYSIHYTKLYDY